MLVPSFAVFYWERFAHLFALLDRRKTFDPYFGAEVLPGFQSCIVCSILFVKLHLNALVPVAFVRFGTIFPFSVGC